MRPLHAFAAVFGIVWATLLALCLLPVILLLGAIKGAFQFGYEYIGGLVDFLSYPVTALLTWVKPPTSPET